MGMLSALAELGPWSINAPAIKRSSVAAGAAVLRSPVQLRAAGGRGGGCYGWGHADGQTCGHSVGPQLCDILSEGCSWWDSHRCMWIAQLEGSY